MSVVALAGGVGAARFLRGLVRVVPPEDIVIVGNTGDDEDFFGLHVSPDLDTVTYTLAGVVGTAGWGIAGDSFRALDALANFGEPAWFRLGDADLATHLYRTDRLRAGATLSEVTAEIALAFGLKSRLVPMSDDRVATRIEIFEGPGMGQGPGAHGDEGSRIHALEEPGEGPTTLAANRAGGNTTPEAHPGAAKPPETSLAMQEWFVRERAEPPVRAVRFDGAETARPAPGVLEAIAGADAVLLCPSNPVISIGPILAIPGLREAVAARRARVVAVSPIIHGAPVKGPADRLMAAIGLEVSCAGIASAYTDICGTLLVDTSDAARMRDVEAHDVRAVIAPILMRDADDAERLARTALESL